MIHLLSYRTYPVTAVGLHTVFSEATDMEHRIVSTGIDQFSATVEELQPEFNGKRKVKLSRRERQLLALLSRCYGNPQIAGNRSLSEGTVRVCLSKLFKKGGCQRPLLTMYGLRSMPVINADTDNIVPHELWSSTFFFRDSAGIPT